MLASCVIMFHNTCHAQDKKYFLHKGSYVFFPHLLFALLMFVALKRGLQYPGVSFYISPYPRLVTVVLIDNP